MMKWLTNWFAKRGSEQPAYLSGAGKPKQVLTDSELFSDEQLGKIERHYGATYICETCIKGTGGNWVNKPVAVFYQPNLDKAPPGASHWFGLYYTWQHPMDDDPVLMITNAKSATEPFKGVVAKNGDVIYSRYRHDYVISPDETASADGGRDYLRSNKGNGIVTLQIIKDKLEIIG
jgi:hypothetical protein